MDNRAIGVFDSGLGGLTVLKEIIKLLPDESIVYFGDNGRAPYGIKSVDTIRKYALQDANFLVSKDVKLIVIACNTASACAVELIREKFNIPVIEVIEPGALAAVNSTRNKKVGVIGTSATIRSGVYEAAIKRIDNSVQTFAKACPLFVPLVEEGWWEEDITRLTAEKYLSELISKEIDALVLGCTHYPLLENTLNRVVGSSVTLVNSAKEVAKVVARILNERNIQKQKDDMVSYKFYTSDSVDYFMEMSKRIFGEIDYKVERVDIDKY